MDERYLYQNPRRMVDTGFNLQLFAEEKTEEATPHRREEARRKGQVAKSPDLNAALVMAVVVVLLFLLWQQAFSQIGGFFTWLLGGMLQRELTTGNLSYLFSSTAYFFLQLMAPVFLAALAVGLAANLMQIGFLLSPESLKFKLENLNPLNGFKRMLSKRAVVDLIKSLLKVTVVAIVTYAVVRGSFHQLLFLADMSLPQGVALVAGLVFRVGLAAVMVFLVLAVLDFIFQRYDFRQRLRMSKQEVKEELKQTEGDPQLKAKLRERQRQMAMRRMMHSVPNATVVITNPIHLAVALLYKEGETEAPQVLAKGAGDVAHRITAVAREHRVPVVENRPVAQFLFKNVEIGQQIPVELYQAVAEILAMLYRIKKRH